MDVMSEALQALERELVAASRPVPDAINHTLAQAETFAISQQEFLLNLPSGLRFHYKRGAGVSVERPAHIDDREYSLFQRGTLAAAVAMLNDMTVLHVSAVEYQGAVFAFAAPSGGGKSTLAAGLQERGFVHYCDDTLLVRLTPQGLVSAPSQHQIKLWYDALELTGYGPSGPVRSGMDKYFVAQKSEVARPPRPLKALYNLGYSHSGEILVKKIDGAQRLTRVRSALYRPHIAAALWSTRTAFEKLSEIAAACAIYEFERPHAKGRYWEGVDAIAAHIRSHSRK